MGNRIICLLLTIITIFSFTGCRKKDSAPDVSAESSALPALVSTPKPTPEATPKPTAELTLKPTPAPTPSETLRPLLTETPMPLATGTPMPLATREPFPDASVTPDANAPVITKQPNGEGHYEGESAVFVAGADRYTSLHWTAVSPSGRQVTMNIFRDTFLGCTVIGDNDTTLTITNLTTDMSGWSFYCTFENNGSLTKTNSARLKVTATATGTGTGSSSGSTSKKLRCPSCGSEVPRNLLNCPFCGGEIYTKNETAVVNQDDSGDIFYMDNTGMMYYEDSTKKSTYVDTNTNYTVFNESGLVQSGNYNKERKEEEKRERLEAFLNGEEVDLGEMMELGD